MSKASEMVLYRTCKRMIQRGTIDGLAEKIDIFYAAGKLTDEHYTELTGLLAAKQPKPKPTAFMPSRMPLSTCMLKVLAPSRLALRQITLKTPKPMQCMPIMLQYCSMTMPS